MKCPECNSRSVMIRTDNLTKYLRNITHMCKNSECAMTFVTQEEFVRIVQKPKSNQNAHHPT